ncbi:MAG: relaxase domain-containing protein [Verrucomicrobia bacterium]|jgi:conjugative relaxase-like TrwC/TraI family protein|nr:relaxase domain-containing protein [Verrucomicrobiota bacterium]
MVTAKTQYNLANAREYFEEHLCVGDYYDEGQRVSGEWQGLGAERLGLAGRVRADDFLRLCENQHPATGETLTQRLNTTRADGDGSAANRRIFYDFTFSPPKSVSLAGFLGEDTRVLEAHARAVKSALREFEAFASTRIRAGGEHSDRRTRNFAAALFTHDTSRALDPHLHTHCIVFNATYDASENRWKALQNYEMLRARKFAENAYYHELARELRGFGYRIRNLSRGDFQIEGIPAELCDRFSKRDAEIDKALAKLLADKPELTGSNIAELRARLATEKRTRKQKDLSRDELRAIWGAQLSQADRELLRGLTKSVTEDERQRTSIPVVEAVQWAEEHLFDRNSVVLECQVWQEALGRARGEDFSLAELKQLTDRRGYIRDADRPGELTKRDVLLREWEIVQTAKEGIGDCWPLVPNPQPTSPKLDDEQRKALDGLLGSTNLVSVFRGGAGTGKSFVLHELVRQIQQSGRLVAVLAPQRQQVVDMEKAGFPSPATVASFLTKAEFPERAVIVVDEAGQIGGQQMLMLLRFAKERNARVVLSGDTRQHGAVEASDALLAIERHAGVKPVELHTIRRQDPGLARDNSERASIKRYRNAVEAAAAGKLAESFKQLDQMGAVVGCGLGEQADKLADEYLRLMERNASVVVVSQTWGEVHRVNARVREALKAKGLVGANDTAVQVLERVDLTNAQKRDERFYPQDAVIVFNQKVREADAGAKGRLSGILRTGLLVEVGGRFVTVSNKMLDHISVCQTREIAVATGDRLHLKANRKLASGGRVTNGELVAVKSVRSDGSIELADGRVLDASFREFLPGYAVTSYGSQGKTVDYVLFSDSTIKAATNAQQWYVTISRGRRGIRIFTPDKEQLRENVTRSGHRPLAMELAAGLTHRRGLRLWDRLHGYVLRFGRRAADNFRRLKHSRRRHQQPTEIHEHKNTRMLGERSKRSRGQNRSVG